MSDQQVRSMIRQKGIVLGGNSQLKIYGKLSCKSGKSMRRENRVFFTHLSEAHSEGYRPCGNCLRQVYNNWKNGSV